MAAALQEDSENNLFTDCLSDHESVYNFDDSDNDLQEATLLANEITMELENSGLNTDEEMRWDNMLWTCEDVQRKLEDFEVDPGLKVLPDDPTNMKKVLDLFIDDHFFSLLVEESNRYFEQNRKIGDDRSTWKEISIVEMKQFLGLIVLMAQIPKESLDDYWTTKQTIETPFFRKIMPYHRFLQIWRHWHFSNNAEESEHPNRFIKIAPVFNYFQERFNNVYKPTQQLCLARSVIPWKGLDSFQFDNLRNEINLHGISVGMLCESDSGYICNLEVLIFPDSSREESALSILGPYLNLGYHVYVDDYYNSVPLVEELLKAKTRVCGTIKSNRGLPPSLRTVQLNKGDIAYLSREEILIQVIQTTKHSTTNIITTIHASEKTDKENYHQKVRKQDVVAEYNKHMKEYYCTEQSLMNYSIVRKTRKWPKRYVMFLINMALLNSFKIYSMLYNKKITFRDFLHDVGEQWANTIPNTILKREAADSKAPLVPTRRISKYDPPTRLYMDMSQHKLKPLISRTGKPSQRQCRVCIAKRMRSRTLFFCVSCNVPLHKGRCFELYHTYVNYWRTDDDH